MSSYVSDRWMDPDGLLRQAMCTYLASITAQLKRNYRLDKWNIIYSPEDQGGLRVEVLEIKNNCLLIRQMDIEK